MLLVAGPVKRCHGKDGLILRLSMAGQPDRVRDSTYSAGLQPFCSRAVALWQQMKGGRDEASLDSVGNTCDPEFAAVPVASAASPQAVETATTPGLFTSDIPGCEDGTWEDELLHVAGNFDKLILNLKVDKTLHCEGGDDLVIRFLPKVRGVPFPQSGPWTIVDEMLDSEEVYGSGWMTVDVFGGVPEELSTGKIHIG